MVAVFVKLNTDRNKKMTRGVIPKKKVVLKTRRGRLPLTTTEGFDADRDARIKKKKSRRLPSLPIDLDKLPTKQYGKGRDSDQPRKPMEPESAAEKKANDKLYKRMKDRRDRDRALYD